MHHRAFESAIRNLHSVEVVLDDKAIQGMTDRLILGMLAQEGGIDEGLIEESMPGLLELTKNYFLRDFRTGDYVLLPGVEKLLKDAQVSRGGSWSFDGQC